MDTTPHFCPFRRTDSGDFAECYGEKCMAYCEYDQPVLSLHDEGKTPPVHVVMCRMMTQPVYYGGGGA